MTETPTPPRDDEAREAAAPDAPACRPGTPPPPDPDAAAATAGVVRAEPAEDAPVEDAPSPPDDAATAVLAEAAPVVPAHLAPPGPVDLSPAACAARLAELFPALFGAGRALPIKLRIQSDIQQRAPGLFTRKSLSPFLHRYTTGTAYLKALVNSPHRFDLDGAPAGEIDDVHRQAAAAELERRRGVVEARRAAEREAQREAQREARRAAAAAEAAARTQHAAEDQARRDRGALLRAYESSTLTRANFCVLKGILEADLDGLLHQAWLEREQRAQEARPTADRGPPPGAPQRPQEPAAGRPQPPSGGRERPRRGAPHPRGTPGAKPAR